MLSYLLVVLAASAAAGATPPSQPITVAPEPAGEPHQCDAKWYAREVYTQGEEGSADLRLHIGVDGQVKDATIARSSGYPEIDEGSIRCVRSWTYKPALMDGKPTPADVTVTVDLHRQPRPHACTNYPHSLQSAGLEGTTVLSFAITADGFVKNAKIVESSGNPDLDAAALYCPHNWHYIPAQQNGKPVEVLWTAKIKLVRPSHMQAVSADDPAIETVVVPSKEPD